MCGICGVVGAQRAADAEAVIRRMMAALRHRGPDDEGLLVVPPGTPPGTRSVALGMRRLSIIDLAGGHQPVFNEAGNVAVVFNGEIYNFQELRQKLEAAGHIFNTRSDTEAIVHAYEAWGEDCVQHLRGMFAIAVFDGRERPAESSPPSAPRVFLARDRLGIKPLYYAWVGGVLLFASEVRALLQSKWISPRLSSAALESYLLFGSVAEPMTLVEGVFSLPPGHCMSVAVSEPPGEEQPKPYWDFASATRNSAPPTERHLRAAAARLRPLLEDAVRSHLIADVPLGLFLSSGLDSTTIAALASREQHGIHSFTVVFPEQDFSEAVLARQIAEHFGTQHQELLLSGDQMLARVEEAVAALDQPSMDGINTYFVSWAAQQVGLKVALSGLGGDEVFGGYSTFRSTPRATRLAALGKWVPRAVRRATAAAVVKMSEGGKRADAARKLAAVWRDADDLPHPYFLVRALFTPEQSSRLLNGSLESVAADSPWRAWLAESARQAATLDSFAAVSCLEMRTYMVNTLLRDTDTVSMSHSLEVRVPLLDHRLVEYVAQLPETAKRRRGTPKALLVEALADLLPGEVVAQPKRTFTFPWERWLRGTLGQRVAAALANLTPSLQPVLKGEAVRAVWHDFLCGRTSWSRPWSLYVLSEWCRRHLDAGLPQPERPVAASASARASAVAGRVD
ncbi:MAG: asparagine synthase (glutamine-hydrolyzing) [Acidobacteria bacterium]|nr:asparagine synthase (glutamine-hydrolyzing) [Acidobacteriota bacterium]